MPLYTYVMTYRGKTKLHQGRGSNFTGSIMKVVGEVFPELGKKEPALQDAIMRQRPIPVTSATHVWELRCSGDESDFIMNIVETRD